MLPALVSAVLALPALSALPALQREEPAPPAADPDQETPAFSAFTLPLHLDELPPEVRSLRLIHLVHDEVPKARGVERTKAEALELGRHVATLLRAGEDFEELCREYSAGKNAATGGVLGSFTPGVLTPAMNDFLFSAEVGAISDPVETPTGIQVMQRIETYAATRHILVRGRTEASREEAEALLERARAGEDFGALAAEASDDPYSRARRGLFTLFERGPNDRLLKAAAFEAEVGEVVGPIESSSGYHLIQRVPVEGHPEDLRETTLVRARAILISHDNTPLGGITAERSMQDAELLATELRDRIRSGEDMAALAREHNDDPTGKERAGDLGWIHLRNPRSAPFLRQLFRAEPGELIGPILTNVGFVIARREL